jgi:predicted kinase
LSPANLAGERAALVFNPNATFPLARALRSPEGAPLGEVYSFVSGLYFRGKMTYAQAFGTAPEGFSGALVISPSEGLRFLYERVTLERLRSWAHVSIDESNPRFTEPLLAHATALERAFGDTARFVLLGSVATNKYVGPLTQVFQRRLLFPAEFVGRGDMSRGAMLLRAARASKELDYVPIVGAERHGSRPARRPALASPAPDTGVIDLVILIGLPGAGKSTFFRQRFGATHVHVSKDDLRHQGRTERRQAELVQQALERGRSVVVDNTNVSGAERAPLIAQAQREGARVVGYFFDSAPHECIIRNQAREGRARIPAVGIFAAARRLVPPSHSEGFDELYTVQTLPEQRFEVSERRSEASEGAHAPS